MTLKLESLLLLVLGRIYQSNRKKIGYVQLALLVAIGSGAV